MGNCRSCAGQRQRTSLTSTSSMDYLSHSYNENRLINRFTHRRPSSSPHNLNALIDETLVMIRTVIDSDQEPPYAMFLVSRLLNREDRWLDIIMNLIDRIPLDDPLGATVIALLIDECFLPSQELLQQFIKRIHANHRIRMNYFRSIIDDYRNDSISTIPISTTLTDDVSTTLLDK
jgi:hypothetical protein